MSAAALRVVDQSTIKLTVTLVKLYLNIGLARSVDLTIRFALLSVYLVKSCLISTALSWLSEQKNENPPEPEWTLTLWR